MSFTVSDVQFHFNAARRSAVAVATSTPSITKGTPCRAVDCGSKTRPPVSPEPPSRTLPPLRQRRRRRLRSARAWLFARVIVLLVPEDEQTAEHHLPLRVSNFCCRSIREIAGRWLSWPLSCTRTSPPRSWREDQPLKLPDAILMTPPMSTRLPAAYRSWMNTR